MSQKVASTGTSVSASNSEPSMAKLIVRAIGANILPSMPESVKSGTKTAMMMVMAKTIGRPTS
ncbi:hypothetical protein D3C86_1800050 [compost metagenome]